MALSRYASPDPYTLEELRREYGSADWRGRIRLLRRLTREVSIPPDLVVLAAKDEHAQVRQWIARFGYLGKEDEEQLRADPDGFVRACLRENHRLPHLMLSEALDKDFQSANHSERLATVRNPFVSAELIEKIFEPDNQELALDMEARSELASAFLTNERALDRGQFSYSDWCKRGITDAIGFVDLQSGNRKHFDKLWALASKWPAADLEWGVRYWVYQYVGADDKTKAATYRTCEVPALRRAILRNSRPPVDPYGSSLPENKSTSELTKLGLQDPDPECRRLALDRAGPPPENRTLKYASYAWSMLCATVPNAIAIALALKVFSSASTSSETIVFAILVLIYGAITWTGALQRLAAFEQAVIGARRYLRIIELLKDRSFTKESKESLDESLRKQERTVRKNFVLLIFHSIWSMALTAIALYHLVRALI